jgi:hypothetical protein
MPVQRAYLSLRRTIAEDLPGPIGIFTIGPAMSFCWYFGGCLSAVASRRLENIFATVTASQLARDTRWQKLPGRSIMIFFVR